MVLNVGNTLPTICAKSGYIAHLCYQTKLEINKMEMKKPVG